MTRLAAHIEAAGLIRGAQAAGGFAAVLRKGDRDAGTILVVILENGANPRALERMPQVDGTRPWTEVRRVDSANPREFEDYLARRQKQDDDLWVIELDVPNPERLVLNAGTED